MEGASRPEIIAERNFLFLPQNFLNAILLIVLLLCIFPPSLQEAVLQIMALKIGCCSIAATLPIAAEWRPGAPRHLRLQSIQKSFVRDKSFVENHFILGDSFMLFRMLYDDKLAQASYLIGCQRTGEALIIDP
ncbi:hypothetical protein FBQ85_29970, partial [Cytophagia bacterium CHB2]|nr:hypothetical protein [Cytophagia bacterium CHB2]